MLRETRPEQLRVLLVEDEAAIRFLCKLNLEAEGMLVQEAATGEQAVALAMIQPPDVAILDVMLPGFDGWEVAGRLREAYGYDVGLIFLTAVAVPESERRALTFDALFVTKPFNPLTLHEVVLHAAAMRGTPPTRE